MRTLTLLTAALLLLAFQAQADALPAAAEESPDEEQPGEEDQVMGISFEDPERSALPYAGARKKVLTCYCRNKCKSRERFNGNCILGKLRYSLCCK